MNLVYLFIGILLPISVVQLHKLAKKMISKRKTRPIVRTDDIKQLRNEIDQLRGTVNDLVIDIKQLHEVNSETQKRTEVLFPENFDKDKELGKTVFVKNGEEKVLETIDWRSR